ncbi:HEAT repeat domain-containing protein [Altericista sp. CCNU0014]|uniref:HEAT repeat domain-containing protein n=1 Tax=Altericista sp. CCNU0014 TaxID=3082949 RepID=UPI00384ED101
MPLNTVTPIPTLLQAIEAASSASALASAVEALAQTGNPEATEPLITALGYNNPGAAVAAVDGLIRIGEPAVLPLLSLLDNFNYGARAWAIRALAGIGDPKGLEILLEAASADFALSVRRAAARGLGTIRWEGLSPEQQADGQQRCLAVLLGCAQDPEWVVRYAAIAGVQSLALAIALVRVQTLAQVLEALEERRSQEGTLAVKARILLAQQQVQGLLSRAAEEA